MTNYAQYCLVGSSLAYCLINKVEINQHEVNEPNLVRKVKDWVNKVVEL